MKSIKLKNLSPDKLRSCVLECFDGGYNCAEAIVAGFVSALDADRGMTRLATPFGAGIGGRRDLCGILTGGTLVLGLLFGRDDPSEQDQKVVVYKLGGRYYRWFKTEQKLHCSEIVTGKFSGHTQACVELMDKAQAKLFEIIVEGEENTP